MAKRQLQLTEQEIGEFRHAESMTRDVHELKRLQATRLYGTGNSLVSIIDLLGVGESSVRQWAMRYRVEGLAGLRSHWQGNNANQLTAEQRQLIQARLQGYRPLDLGLSAGIYWTVSDLRVAVQQWFGVVYQDETSYQNLFHASGFSYQRTSKVYRNHPSANELADFESELEKK